MEELFTNVINKLTDFKTSATFTHTEKLCIEEAITRLKGLKTQSLKVLETNATLLNRDRRLKEAREMMTFERISEMLHEGAKTDPALAAHLKSRGKLELVNSSQTRAYNMSHLDETIPDAEDLRQLHFDTEDTYNKLWLIKERLNTIAKFKNFNPKGVREVRNDLIEHTKGSNSGAHIYSFGITTNGPVLRPTKPSNNQAPHDAGLKTNLEEFLSQIKRLLI